MVSDDSGVDPKDEVGHSANQVSRTVSHFFCDTRHLFVTVIVTLTDFVTGNFFTFNGGLWWAVQDLNL